MNSRGAWVVKGLGGQNAAQGGNSRAPKISSAFGVVRACVALRKFWKILLKIWYLGLFWVVFSIDFSLEMYEIQYCYNLNI